MTAPPIVRGPHDLPDWRVWLRDQWRPDSPFRVAAQHAWANVESYCRWEHDTAASATLWWVSEDMVDLLAAAAPNVPAAVRIDELPRPAHAGIVVFAKSLSGIDADNGERTVAVDAIVWGGCTLPPAARGPLHPAGVPSVSVSSYRRLNFDERLRPSELELAIRTEAVTQAARTRIGAAEESEEAINVVEHRGEIIDVARGRGRPGTAENATGFSLTGVAWAPLGRSDWPLDEACGDWSILSPRGDVFSESMMLSAQEDRRVLAALWTLVSQSAIARTTTTVVDRHVRRRVERAGIPARTSDVQVVTLRRPDRTRSDDADGEHAGRQFTHSWLVSGHWRHQPVGPGRAERRLTWVRGHVKGQGPLLVKKRVNAWVR